jgi:hypothetical protein
VRQSSRRRSSTRAAQGTRTALPEAQRSRLRARGAARCRLCPGSQRRGGQLDGRQSASIPPHTSRLDERRPPVLYTWAPRDVRVRHRQTTCSRAGERPRPPELLGSGLARELPGAVVKSSLERRCPPRYALERVPRAAAPR